MTTRTQIGFFLSLGALILFQFHMVRDIERLEKRVSLLYEVASGGVSVTILKEGHQAENSRKLEKAARSLTSISSEKQ